MKRSESLGVQGVLCLLMSLAALLSLSAVASAALYDDFNDGVLNKWSFTSGSGLFSEHDNMLYFNGTAPAGMQKLSATQLFSPDVRVGMEFHDFSSTSTAVPGVTLSATLQLVLGTGSNYVAVMIGHNQNGNFLQVDRMLNGTRTPQYVVGTSLTEGMLGLRYDGTNVYAAYSASITTPDWVQLGSAIAAPSAWGAGSVPLTIVGGTGDSGTTTFEVDNVGYSAVPVPSALLLLAPGLAGLAVMRRRFRK